MDKKCIACHIEKPIGSFYAHPMMADGTLNKCKECCKKHATEHRNANLDRVRAYDRKRGTNEARLAAVKKYQKTKRGREISSKAKREWAARNYIKKKATETVNNALRDKKLFKSETCSRCGLPGKLQAHHPDYSKPLDVLWVHDSCHKAIHKDVRAARREGK
jgi:hypothetical protein